MTETLGQCVLCKQWKSEVDAWQHICNSCADKCVYEIKDDKETTLFFDSEMNLLGMNDVKEGY